MEDFQDILKTASKMKSAQMSKDRPKFDAAPPYLQSSLFQNPDLAANRGLPLVERMGACHRLKAGGTEHFNQGRYQNALNEYQDALALWVYLESRDANWRKNGIQDRFITKHLDWKDPAVISEATDVQRREIKDLVSSCYLNIAACSLRLKQYTTARSACSDALQVDPTNVKALYRRAQALVDPPSSGATEVNMAIRDLKTAARIEPGNITVKKALARLIRERNAQAAEDKATFSGLFERGAVVDDEQEEALRAKAGGAAGAGGGAGGGAGAGSGASDGGLERQSEAMVMRRLAELEALARRWEAEGRTKDAAELRDHLEKEKRKLAKGQRPAPDFDNPSEEMIAKAAAMGVDLTDPAVIEQLRRLSDGGEPAAPDSSSSFSSASTPAAAAAAGAASGATRAGSAAGGVRRRGGAGGAAGAAGAGAAASPEDDPEAFVQSMSAPMLRQFMATQPGMTDAKLAGMNEEQLRAALLKLLKSYRTSKAKQEAQSTRFKYIGIFVALLFFAWRLYSTGMLRWLRQWIEEGLGIESDDIHDGFDEYGHDGYE